MADAPDDIDAINQTAGNVQVDGNWVSQVQAAALQSAAPPPSLDELNQQTAVYQSPGAQAFRSLTGPSSSFPPVNYNDPEEAAAAERQSQVNAALPAGAIGQNPDGSFQYPQAAGAPAAASAPAPAATPWADTQIPSNVGFVPTGQQPTQQAAPPAAVPAYKVSGGGGGGQATNKLFQQTGDAETAAAKAQADVDTSLAKGKLGVGQEQAASEQDLLAQQRANMQQTQQQVQDALSKSQAIAEKFQNQQVDPSRYWGNMGTGDHVLAGLSMILSGLGAGLTGKDNLAVKHFDDAMTQDIAAQRYNIEHGKEASEMYSNLAKEYQAAGLGKQQALDATGLTIRQKALTDASNQALQLGGPQAQAALLKATADIPLKMKEAQSKLVQDTAQTALTRASTAHMNAETQQLGVAAGQAAIERSAELKMANGATLNQLTPQEQQIFKLKHAEEAVPLPNGQVIYAQGKESAGKAMDANEKFSSTDAALQNLVSVMENGSTKEKQAAAATAQNTLATALGVAREAGQPLENENAIRQAIPSPGYIDNIIPGQEARDIARIQAARTVLRESHEGVLRARARPGQVPKKVTFKQGG